MSTVEVIISEIEQLPAEEQSKFFHELGRSLLAKRFRERAAATDAPLPISDIELDQIVHEARGEMLRARGL
jgi:hypothetical protein